MFEVGEYVVCGSNGVCVVRSVGKISLKVADFNREYYTLESVYRPGSMIYIPVDSDKTHMRRATSKEEAEELVDHITDVDALWVKEEKQREQIYKEAMQKYECLEWIKIIRTLYFRKEKRVAEGKKITSTDEKYLHLAQEQLYGELAVALEIPKSEVEKYIALRIEKLETI